ncbi:IS3 family transposase, partial [Myxococcota bacterium]
MIQDHPQLSIRRQCELLSVSRSCVYYQPVGVTSDDLQLMRQIDEVHLEHPFYGSRNIAHELGVNRKCVQRLMRSMGLESMAPKPKTSRPAPEHPTFPYLLRKLKIVRVNQVWAADITYIPLALGFAYLAAIIDWYSRRVLAWRLSN